MSDLNQAPPPSYGTVDNTNENNSAPPYPSQYPSQYPQPGYTAPPSTAPNDPPPKYEDCPPPSGGYPGGYPPQGPGYPPQPPQGYHGYTQQPAGVAHQTVIIHGENYGAVPRTLECPNCQAITTTDLKYTSGGLTWLTSFLICFFGCWLGCCLIPFCIDDLQDVQHHCSNCKKHIGTYHRL